MRCGRRSRKEPPASFHSLKRAGNGDDPGKSGDQTLKDKMMEMGDGSLMSGSGPTVFGLFTNRTAAQAAYEELRYGSSRDLAKQVYLTSFTTGRGHADGEQF